MNTNDPLAHWKKPNISARPRTENETRDLAVRVFARNLKPISILYAIMAVPALLLCYALWIGGFYLLFSEETGGEFYDFFSVACFWWVLVTASVYFLSEFCGVLVTKYLGLWLFSGEETVSLRTTLHSMRGRWGQSIYFLLLTRLIRLRSFYAEIILLENTPFWKTENGVSTKRRVKHVNSSGSFFALGLRSLVTEYGSVYWRLGLLPSGVRCFTERRRRFFTYRCFMHSDINRGKSNLYDGLPFLFLCQLSRQKRVLGRRVVV